jgi:hypothetical protein
VEVHTEIRCHFIAWGFTNVTMYLTGIAHCNVSGLGFQTYLALDGTAIAGTQSTPLLANTAQNIATIITKTLSAENTLHTLSLYGVAQAGVTATWYGEASGLLSCRTGFTISK